MELSQPNRDKTMASTPELSYQFIDGVWYGCDTEKRLIHTRCIYDNFEQWYGYDANGNKTSYKDSTNKNDWWTYDSNGVCISHVSL